MHRTIYLAETYVRLLGLPQVMAQGKDARMLYLCQCNDEFAGCLKTPVKVYSAYQGLKSISKHLLIDPGEHCQHVHR